jgi:hypothetical protein
MPNESEKSYLESQIALLSQVKATLPARLVQLNAEQESRIEALLAEAGVLSRVREIRAGTEEMRRSLQSQSDTLGGKIEALQAVLVKYHLTPAKPAPPRVLSPKVEAHDPVVQFAEVYAGDESDESDDNWDESDGDDTEGDDLWDDGEAIGGDGGRDEIAVAIENATDEAEVRAVLLRYTRKP